jgi:hypothetical protein
MLLHVLSRDVGVLMAEITERDREAAHAVLGQFGECVEDDAVKDVGHTIYCEAVAQALANHAAEARRLENEACVVVKREKIGQVADWVLRSAPDGDLTRRQAGELIVYAIEKRDAQWADAIAARRGGHG